MLTHHNYKKVKGLGTDPKIFRCCQDNDPGDPNCKDCCSDAWESELKKVLVLQTQATEKATQAQSKLDLALKKSKGFKTWLDELHAAEDYSQKICYQLEIIAGQSEKIWYNSLKAVDAIEILFCMIRDFYGQIDYLKTRYDLLITCINTNTDPNLDKDKGIVKCLADYSKKLDDIINTRNAILKLVVQAITTANLIRNNISTKDCPGDYDPCGNSKSPCNCHDKDHPFYGLKTVICEWFCAFGCDEKCEPCEQAAQHQQKQQAYAPDPDCEPVQTQSLCSQTDCKLKPSFSLPLCNTRYRCDLEDCYAKADTEAKDAGEALKNATKESQALTACVNSLRQAIAEVDPSARCK